MSSEEHRRILIIDDDEVMRTLLQMSLEIAGYEVVTARNGAEGRQLLQQGPFAAVLLDLMMPVMDGLRFLRWLRGEGGQTLPAYVLSAVGRAEVVTEARDAGATDVLRKPIDIDEVLSRLRADLGPLAPTRSAPAQ